jgi:hypothetical protein
MLCKEVSEHQCKLGKTASRGEEISISKRQLETPIPTLVLSSGRVMSRTISCNSIQSQRDLKHHSVNEDGRVEHSMEDK